jgi:choline kinase/histidinol phosphatase-like enzyme
MINQVVILAGGLGTRLGYNTAKCLAIVNNKPILHYIIQEFQSQGIQKFHFCLGFCAHEVLDWLKTQNVNFTYSLDPFENCGTWQAIKNAKVFLGDLFFVSYGDSIAFCDLEFMYYQFLESKQTTMMSVSNLNSKDSNFCINSQNKIDQGLNNFVEHGVSIFSRNELHGDERIKNFSDFFHHKKNEKIHYANANYYQINTSEDLEKVNEIFRKFSENNKYNFLDRDGTINVFDEEIYTKMIFKPTDLSNTLDDSDCIIITNQPAKAKNQTTLEFINKINFEARQHLINQNKNVIFTNSCLHREFKKNNDEFDNLRIECNCRKPKTGMLDKAALRLKISPLSTFYGDSECDQKCAEAFGIRCTKYLYKNKYENIYSDRNS